MARNFTSISLVAAACLAALALRTQMAGTNHDMAPDGSRYQLNEPAGHAVALAASRDRGGIFDALGARRTYATTGVRVWLDFTVAGSPMGSSIAVRSAGPISAVVDLMAGMTITRLEVWGAQAGHPFVPYRLLPSAAPAVETWTGTLALQHPVPVGPVWPQEWLAGDHPICAKLRSTHFLIASGTGPQRGRQSPPGDRGTLVGSGADQAEVERMERGARAVRRVDRVFDPVPGRDACGRMAKAGGS